MILIILSLLFVYANPFLNTQPIILGEVMNQWAYPNLFTRFSIGSGKLFLWDNFSGGGYSFIGHPQSQIFYPPSFIISLLFSNQLTGTKFLVLLHLFLFGSFATLLLKKLKLKNIAIAAVLCLYLFNSYMSANILNGYLAEIFTLTWLPLVFYFLQCWIQKRETKHLFFAALAFSMQIYAGALFGVHFTLISIGVFFLLFGFTAYKKSRTIQSLLPPLLKGVVFLLLTVCISSPKLLPVLEYQNFSMRSALSLAGAEVHTWNIEQFFDFFTHFLGVTQATNQVLGILIIATNALLLLLLLSYFLVKKKGFFAIFLIVLSVAAFLAIMGKNFPFIDVYKYLYYIIPGFKFNQYPTRFTLLLYFSLPILIGLGITKLLNSKKFYRCILAISVSLFVIATSMYATKYQLDQSHFPKESYMSLPKISQNNFTRWNTTGLGVNYGPQPYIALLNKTHTLNPPYTEMVPVNAYVRTYRLTEEVTDEFLKNKYKTLGVLGVTYEIEQAGYSDFAKKNPYGEFSQNFHDLKIYTLDKFVATIQPIRNPIFFVSRDSFVEGVIKSRAIFLKYISNFLNAYIISVSEKEFASLPKSNNYVIYDSSAKISCVKNDRRCVSIDIKQEEMPDIAKRLSSFYFDKPGIKFKKKSGVDIETLVASSEIENVSSESGINNISYLPGNIQFNVKNSKPTFFAISEFYYPGWVATIDNRGTSIYLGDSMVKVIGITEPGSHLVKLTYDPLSFKLGLVLFFLGTPLILLLLKYFKNLKRLKKLSS